MTDEPQENTDVNLMDYAFNNLNIAFLSEITTDIDSFVVRFFPEFKAVIIDHFSRNPITSPIQEIFINRFTLIWIALRFRNQLGLAQRFWEHVLLFIQELEQYFNTRIHKGSIYYYWGGTAVLNGELEKGYSLMHSALMEDRETHKHPNPKMPAYRFVYLDYNDPNQHFFDLLKNQGQFLESFFSHYTALSNSKLDGSAFRNRFLSAHPKPESVLLFAYTIARLFNQSKNLPFSPDNTFAGILDLNLLFDLALVIDSSIQAKFPEVGWQYFKLARCLSDRAGLDLSEAQLNFVNEEQQKPGNFANVVIDLLNNSFRMKDGNKLSPLAADIAISYCIRNHAAHNIITQSLVPKHKLQLLEALFDTLFLTVDYLY